MVPSHSAQVFMRDNDCDRAMVDSARAMKAHQDHEAQLVEAGAAGDADE